MEQGKRRETGRDKQNRGTEWVMETHGSIKPFISSFTHSLIQSQTHTRWPPTGYWDQDGSLLPVAAQGWDGRLVTEADRGSVWSPSQPRPFP